MLILQFVTLAALVKVTESQKGTDGVSRPADAQPDQQTAEQQQLAAGPAAGAVEGLTFFDLDLIKLTAQFVARNGKGFLTGTISCCSCQNACRSLQFHIGSSTCEAGSLAALGLHI